MTALALALLVYSAQLLAVVAVAAAAAAVLRLTVPSTQLAYWRAVGVLCLLLPVQSLVRPDGPVASVTFPAIDTASVHAAVAASRSSFAALATALVWAYAAGAIARLVWLLAGAIRLRNIRERSLPAALDPELDALRREIAPRAEFRWTGEIDQPVTFGLIRPIVLLPSRFAALGREARCAVACHELLHVRRRDWAWIVVEEHLRAVFWFHPGAWWVLEEVQLSREQLVDRTVVTRVSSRRAYMEALLAFADGGRVVSPSIAFLRRRHLQFRLRQLAKEPHMTGRRTFWTMTALALITGVAAAGVVRAIPLDVPFPGLQAASSARLEIRLAETEASAGLVPTVGPGGDSFYLHPEPVATAADVTAANVVASGSSQFGVAVRFSDAASSRLLAATQAHVGRPMAVLLDGEVIAAPTVRAPVEGSAVISGNFTEDQATRIARALVPAASVEPAAPQKAVDAKAFGVTMPAVTSKVQPRYTAAAMEAKIEGVVMMDVIVEADGSVGHVEITNSLDAVYGLDDEAIDAVRQWQFTPGTAGGKTVPVRVTIEMRFTLK